jgi:uncharacterized protein (DUF2336 family)
MAQNYSLIAELETAIQSGSKEKRVDALRRVTDLFVADADRLNDQQIDVFDDVLSHLIQRIEGRALAELSHRLGVIDNAPAEVVRRLATNDDIAVAEPILSQSRRLSDHDLIEIASTKSQSHLLAISGRKQIAAPVTDALLQRGDRQVFYKLAENSGARFSDEGYAALVKHSERDERLAEKVGFRLDIPLRLFRELLLRATEAVRSRLLAAAGPENRQKIQTILATISETVQHEAGFHNERDYAEAQGRVLAMKEKGELGDAAFFEFAASRRFAEIVAALALLTGAGLPLVESLLQSEHSEAWLIPCKVAGLDWSAVRALLTCGVVGRPLSGQGLEIARADYFRLSRTSAGRVLRFWQVRQSASKNTEKVSPD